MKANGSSLIDLLNLSFLFGTALLALGSRASLEDPAGLPWALAGLLGLWVVIRRLRQSRGGAGWRRLGLLVGPIGFHFAIFMLYSLLVPTPLYRVDGALQSLDRLLGAGDPPGWRGGLGSPLLTELMHVLYFAYFPLPLVVLIWLYRCSRFRELEEAMTLLLGCFYSGYLLWLAFPAVSPRFSFTGPALRPGEGLFLAGPIERWIDSMEMNKFDAFPSLHAAITLMTLLLAFRHSKLMAGALLPICLCILASLVYLRQHYLVDVLGGIGLALLIFGLLRRVWPFCRERLTPHFGAGERERPPDRLLVLRTPGAVLGRVS